MPSFSFQTRLVFAFIGLLLLALVIPLRTYYTSVQSHVLKDTTAQAVGNVEVVQWLLETHDIFDDRRAFDTWLDELGERFGFRITYIVDGRVIADSDVPFEELGALDDHANRPEILQAASEGEGVNVRFSRTLGKELIYAATAVKGGAGMEPGILRLAVPVSTVRERLSEVENEAIWVFALTLMGTVILGILLSRHLVRTLQPLSETARAIGKGEYSKRIRFYPGREFRPLAESINMMAENIEKHIREMEEQRSQLIALFNGMTEGVLVLDGKGHIHTINTALKHMFPGIDDFMGRHVLEATMNPEIHRAVEDMLGESTEPIPLSAEVELPENRFVRVNFEPFRDSNGARRVVLVFHDISEIKRLEVVRRDFVANVSHELKTPLTSIKGYSETLLDMTPEQLASGKAPRKFLEIIRKNADHMNSMVSGLLALAKSEHRGRTANLVAVDSSQAMRRARNVIRELAAERGIEISGDLEQEGPFVMAEEDGLLHVFQNLFDNALKYCPENSTIHIESEMDGSFVKFCVIDEGPGIPQASRERVFERFYRVDQNQAAKDGSAGLGLAICKHIILSFGGKIWVEDTSSGSGAKFCFTVALASEGQRKPTEAETAAEAV